MLRSGQIARIKRLAREGVSIRNISRATGVARETVRHVLHGRGSASETNGEQADANAAGKTRDRREIEVADPELYNVQEPVFTGPPGRCPSCGGLGYQPCLACRLRKRPTRKKAPIPRSRNSA